MRGSKLSIMPWRACLLVALLLIGEDCFPAVASDSEEWDHGEVFSEDLFLRPLPDGKVLSHFYFKNTLRDLGSAAHHHVFPKAISQLVKKFHISEMELSFTQGRWNYERWGALDPIASANAKPLGVELWAAFDLPLEQVDATWRNLTHALSGLFCASINSLESPALMAAPEFTFGPDSGTSGSDTPSLTNRKGGAGRLRYGALPREAVCTENLTPWLKLLPCRDKAGISVLLDRPSIYRGFYHSLRVHLRSGNSGIGGTPSGSRGTILEQTLTLVLQPPQPSPSSNDLFAHWSLSSVFGRSLPGSCPLATSSHVLLELESSLVHQVWGSDSIQEKAEDNFADNLTDSLPDNLAGKLADNLADSLADNLVDNLAGDLDGNLADNLADNLAYNLADNLAGNAVFKLRPYPDRVLHGAGEGKGDETRPPLLLDYRLEGYSEVHPLNLEMVWKEQVSWPSVGGPFRVSRFLVGSGNQKGSIVIELKSNEHNLARRQNSASDGSFEVGNVGETVEVTVFHVVPWYVRLYTHTLTAVVDGHRVPLREVATRMRIVPAEDRLSPATMEMQLQLARNISILSLTVEFDKGFLHIDEHPPDANRGFDLPSALISFPASGTQRVYRSLPGAATGNGSPFLQTLKDGGPVHVYSESLLLPLATPDFSMPYNVITFTCTILALYFGSILNTLRRRIGEEERRLAKPKDQTQGKLTRMLARYMDGKSETQKKLIKMAGVVGVAAIAFAANQFFNLG